MKLSSTLRPTISSARQVHHALTRSFPSSRPLSMAWRCSGATNSALIENMWKNGLITDPLVKEAFLKVTLHSQYKDNSDEEWR
jgi:hypothetical protein